MDKCEGCGLNKFLRQRKVVGNRFYLRHLALPFEAQVSLKIVLIGDSVFVTLEATPD